MLRYRDSRWAGRKSFLSRQRCSPASFEDLGPIRNWLSEAPTARVPSVSTLLLCLIVLSLAWMGTARAVPHTARHPQSLIRSTLAGDVLNLRSEKTEASADRRGPHSDRTTGSGPDAGPPPSLYSAVRIKPTGDHAEATPRRALMCRELAPYSARAPPGIGSETTTIAAVNAAAHLFFRSPFVEITIVSVTDERTE